MFEREDYELYTTLEQVLIKAMLDKSFEKELQKVIGFYNDDFKNDILRVQLRTLPAVIGQSEASVNTHEYFLKQLKKPIRNLISEVVKMIKLVIVMPTANAVSEHSFSTMRCLYTYLRTNMGSSRLSNAMVLCVHKAQLDKLSMVDVPLFESDHRKILLGRFDDVDLRKKIIPVKSVGIQIEYKSLNICS